MKKSKSIKFLLTLAIVLTLFASCRIDEESAGDESGVGVYDDYEIEAFIESYMYDIAETVQLTQGVFLYYNILIDAIRAVDADASDMPFESRLALEIEALKAAYADINEHFRYINMITQHLTHVGYFYGDKKFVLHADQGMDLRNQWNSVYEYYFTQLNTVMMGRTLYDLFDNDVAVGRNFVSADFYINTLSDTVKILLGYDYMGVYDIGDILSLNLYGADVNFEVIGFYNQGTTFAHLNFGFENILFDQSVIMPMFTINQPPEEDEIWVHWIHYTQMLHGNIRIMESNHAVIREMNEEIHASYLERLNELTNRHGLYFDVALLPIPVVYS
ncbi:MAG: hypothetical protein FWF80_03875 [Defluviitaleaceae bacterium]|nr:hypothetical protein [Defluviitaleaceae bacterium]